MLNVSCPTTPNTDLSCVTDIPNPPASFTDNASTTDSIDFDTLQAGFDILEACGEIVVTYSDADNGGQGCSGMPLIVTRTYRILDDLNTNGMWDTGEDTTTCSETFTIVDQTAPTIMCPGDITIYLDAGCVLMPADTMPSSTGVPTDTMDNCTAIPKVTYSDNVSAFGCTAGMNPYGTIMRMWSAMDSCNNMASCTQTITIQDTIPPMITVCAATDTVYVNANCMFIADTMSTGVPTATDNCSAVGFSFRDDTTDLGCTNKLDPYGKITRTWMAMDSCGNVDS